MNTKQLLKRLIDSGMTQTQIAEQVPITQGRISQILKEGGDCSYEAGKAIAELVEKLTTKTEVAG